MKEVTIVKRDGSRVNYDVSKVKQSIAMAVEGTEANALELESRLELEIKPGITTKEIQAIVIRNAFQLATIRNPEWLKVAGRAVAMDEWASFKLKGKTLGQVIKHNIRKSKNGYTKELLDFYTEEDLVKLDKTLKFERDLKHTYSSLVTAKKKYLGTSELNQHMHMVNAMRFGQQEPQETRLQFVIESYHLLSNRKLSLASPFMSNLRKGGNVASCFIISIADDLDSIFDNVKRVAKISKNGGGVGVYLGQLRAMGSDVNGIPNAAGPIVQWIKLLNDTAVAVNQGGKRAGAVTVALPVWHNDIMPFLDMQNESGDQHLRAYDVFPQICAPDLFMQRVEEKGSWITFCPFEVKQKLGIEMYGLYGDTFNEAYAKIEEAFEAGKLTVATKIDNARVILKRAMKAHFEGGLPYIAFTCEINRHNPNKHEGYIPCVNLCTESFSNVQADKYGHVCNLLSVVLGNIADNEELAYVTQMGTKILDYGIALTNSPDPITQAHNNRYRTIGIGIQGLHDWLAKNGLNYSSTEQVGVIAEIIQYNAVIASTQLSKQLGPFEAFQGSTWQTGERIAEFKKHTHGVVDWDYAQSQIDLYGMRNSQLTSPAPNTSTSIYQDSAASILPVFETFFKEDNKNGSQGVVAKFLKEFPKAYEETQITVNPLMIIDMVAEIQKFFDTGVSMELMFDQRVPGFNAKKLYDAIIYAWVKKCKAIYYIRSVKNNSQIEKPPEPDCDSCAG